MYMIRTSLNLWNHALNDVTRLCLFAATGCFFAGALFLLADIVVPLGPRGIALLAVGCFFLAHGVVELARHRWQASFRKRGIPNSFLAE
jgi:hypothetical protein